MKLGLIAPTVVALVALGCGGRTHGPVAPESEESGASKGPLPDSGSDGGVVDTGLPDVPLVPSSMDGGSLDGAFIDGTVVALPLLRLTATEYVNTVNDLLSVPPSAQSVPPPFVSTAGGFAVGTGGFMDDVAQMYHDSAVSIASQVVANLTSLLAPVH